METNVVKIPLSKGQFALIDYEDFELVSKYKWYAKKSKNTYYAVCSVDKYLKMHRLILGLSDTSVFADHINGNGIDNRRSNLRSATPTQNSMNRSSAKNSSSKYKGVYWDEDRRKWASCMKSNGKTIYIGRFDNESEAALAYNKKATEVQGEFARLNII